jgi:hypothetical protein
MIKEDIKIIKRANTTTYLTELRFHVLQNEEEFKNVYDGNPKSLVWYSRHILDETKFIPYVSFMIVKDGWPITEWLKYIIKADDLVNYPEVSEMFKYSGQKI